MMRAGQRVRVINHGSPNYGAIGVVIRASEEYVYIRLADGHHITKRLENIKLVGRRMPVSPVFLQEACDETV